MFSLEFSSNDSDALISIESPEKKQLKEKIFAKDYSKPETLALIVPKTGIYRLKIKAAQSVNSGNYNLKFNYRNSIPGDDKRISAQKSFEEAEKLTFNVTLFKNSSQGSINNEEVYLKCVEKFKESIDLLEAANDMKSEKQDFENEIKIRRRFGDMYRIIGKDDEAMDQYNKSLIASRAIEDRNNEAVNLILISQIQLKKGESKEALFTLNAATDALQLNLENSIYEKRYRAYADVLVSAGRFSEAQQFLALLNITNNSYTNLNR